MGFADLGMGTTEHVFQHSGKRPWRMEILKSLVRDEAMLCAVPLSI